MMVLTCAAVLRHAVRDIIDADLSLQETRDAVMSLIPEEYRVQPHGALSAGHMAADALSAPPVTSVLPQPSGTHAAPFRQAAKSRLNGGNNHVLISAGTDKSGEW
ncbi:hypothetical protein [Arthrobacter sp. 92]|uniref:hypothetical protein n=1 Tax=Arthrobacter sp. 92 TaxID=3418175 RepID=UPI003D041609